MSTVTGTAWSSELELASLAVVFLLSLVATVVFAQSRGRGHLSDAAVRHGVADARLPPVSVPVLLLTALVLGGGLAAVLAFLFGFWFIVDSALEFLLPRAWQRHVGAFVLAAAVLPTGAVVSRLLLRVALKYRFATRLCVMFSTPRDEIT